MDELERLQQALINADRAGDVEGARTLALALREAQARPQQAPQRSVGQDLARQAGLTGRYAVEGPMQLLNTFVGDPAATAVNYATRGVNALAGTNIPRLGMPSQATTELLDATGVKPETPLENVVGAVSKGVSGAGPIVRGAQAAPEAVRAAAPFLRSVYAAPGAEAVAQGVGAGASEATKQMGGGTAAQLIAGALAPLGVSTTGSAVKAVGRAANELRRPVTQRGAEQIAADVLGRLTQDKTAAISNLRAYEPAAGVPGSRPTAGAIAGDYGLAGAQQVISRGDANPAFASRAAENNAARIALLERLNATTRQVETYVAKRDEITGPLREQAFANARGPVDLSPVAAAVERIAQTPAGGRVESQKALDWVYERLMRYQQEGRVDPANAYALHQDLGALIAGKVRDNAGSPIRLAGGLANNVKQVLAREIEKAAPGFQRYLETYTRLSRPIERLEAITERLGGQNLTGVTTSLPSVVNGQPQFTLSQHQMRKAVQDLTTDQNLAPRQQDILARVGDDLNLETFAARGGKQPGSDTFQNMAAANLVNRVLGGTLAESGLGKAMQTPLNWVSALSRPFESRITDIINAAFQDPQLMRRLLEQSRTSRGSPTLAGLVDYSAPRLTGGLFGSLSQ